jgi:hypothetical protein
VGTEGSRSESFSARRLGKSDRGKLEEWSVGVWEYWSLGLKASLQSSVRSCDED